MTLRQAQGEGVRAWSAGEIDLLRRLAAEGRSASAIAAALGRSRNAVVGKVMRLNDKTVRLLGNPPLKAATAKRAAGEGAAPQSAQNSRAKASEDNGGTSSRGGEPMAGEASWRAVARSTAATSEMMDATAGPAPFNQAEAFACMAAVVMPFRMAIGGGRCLWPTEPYDAPAGPQMLVCGQPAAEPAAAPGKRARTHCFHHLRLSVGRGPRDAERASVA